MSADTCDVQAKNAGIALCIIGRGSLMISQAITALSLIYFLPFDAVGAVQNIFDVAIQLIHARLAGVEFSRVCLIRVPGVTAVLRVRLRAIAVPFEILINAAAPIPGIGKVQHGFHITFA